MKRLLLLAATLAACHITLPQNPPGPDADAAPLPPPTPKPSADAAPPPPADAGKLDAARPPTRCERAWQRIQVLNCMVIMPRTATWTQACENAEQNGVDMHAACVATAATCAAVKACLGEH